MNKQEKIIVGCLIAALFIYSFIAPRLAPPPPPVPPASAAPSTPTALTAAPQPDVPTAPQPDVPTPATTEPSAPTAVERTAKEVDTQARPPESTHTLTSGELDVELTTRGGGVRSVTLHEYRDTVDPHSEPHHLHFDDNPALRIQGVPGLPAGARQAGRSVRRARDAAGL